MNPMVIAVIIGLLFIAFLGFIGRKKAFNTNSGWSIANRSMSSLTTFFLQAGGIFTSFTFLGMSGLALLGGVSAAYMPAYLIIGYIGMFLIGPLVWKVAKVYGYHTNADMIGHQFGSTFLGKLVAVLAVVFFTPIVQVQIIGLGTIVSFSTGDKAAGTLSMVISTILILAFVSFAGLKGVATTAYFKDVAMMVGLAIILFGAFGKFGAAGLMEDAMSSAQSLFHVAPGTQTYGITWFVTSVIISGIGLGSMTLPESWPAVLSASKSRGVSKNHVLLPLYTLGTFIPIILGFYAATHLTVEKGQENSAILTLAQNSLPTPLMVFIVIAGISCAMVPAAHCVLSIATLISTNFVPKNYPDEKKLKVGKIASAVILILSLGMSIARPDLMANLYLLTYAGLAQIALANILAVTKETFIGKQALIAGILAGEAVVIFFTFFSNMTIGVPNLLGMNNGVTGLIVNVIVTLIVALATPPAVRPQLADLRKNA
jgi:SSS family solute:Na+ symporter